MNPRLMTPEDLVEITGRRRHSKQAEWFEKQFGIAVVRRGDHSVVMTWDTYEALNAKKNGLMSSNGGRGGDVDLCYD